MTTLPTTLSIATDAPRPRRPRGTPRRATDDPSHVGRPTKWLQRSPAGDCAFVCRRREVGGCQTSLQCYESRARRLTEAGRIEGRDPRLVLGGARRHSRCRGAALLLATGRYLTAQDFTRRERASFAGIASVRDGIVHPSLGCCMGECRCIGETAL